MQIQKPTLFPAQQFSANTDLEQLQRFLDILPDEALIRALDAPGRGGRKPNYQAHVLWRIMIASIYFRHQYVAGMLAELQRNARLRDVCGLGVQPVPKDYHMSRFFAQLLEQQPLLEEMFAALVKRLQTHLPDLGKNLALDSTHLRTNARGKRADSPEPSADPEATWGVKVKRRKSADGTPFESVMKWFGYKLHLLVDSVHELPVAFTVTTAKMDDAKQLPFCVGKAQATLAPVPAGEKARGRFFEDVPLAADKAYDETENYRLLHEEYRIKPVIDFQHAQAEQGTVYDRDRATRVRNEKTDTWHEMRFLGYEKDREVLKYGCPCDGKEACPFFGARCNRAVGGAGLILRVKLAENYRYYTAIPREAKKWKREYRKRTAVERVNSRLKQVLNLEYTGFRGQKKVTARATMGLLIMLAHALQALEENRPKEIRSIRGSTDAVA
jgi:hypothetical protein